MRDISPVGGWRRALRFASGRALLMVLSSTGAMVGAGTMPARAETPMVKYIGMHPLSPHQGDFCYIDAIHYHRFVPVDLRVYVTLDGAGDVKGPAQLYVGDPAWLGYDGPKVGYFGPHPLTVPLAAGAGPLYCYITAPHYHAAAPAPSASMVSKSGVYWYLGPPPPVDVQRSWINEVHAIKAYVPPGADLSMAPPGYQVFHVGADEPPPAAAQRPSASPVGAGAGGASGGAAAKGKAPGARPARAVPAASPLPEGRR